MACGKFSQWEFIFVCGWTVKAKDIVDFIRKIISNCIYGLHALLGVWRVTVALQNESYWWLLLLSVFLLIDAVLTYRKDNKEVDKKKRLRKWFNPSVCFYLLSTVPSIWILELKLLTDRQSANLTCVEGGTYLNDITQISLDNQGWTLALQQIPIFALVFGKWIAGQGDSAKNDEVFSQLLLAQIAAGADITGILDTFGGERIEREEEIVYLCLFMWTWGLLQFCLVPTSIRDELKPQDEVNRNRFADKKKNMKSHSEITHHRSSARRVTGIISGSVQTGNQLTQDADSAGRVSYIMHQSESEKITIGIQDDEEASTNISETLENNESNPSGLNSIKKSHEGIAFNRICHCFYNEIWGIVVALMFQDFPFLITRLIIIFYYRVVSHSLVFFTMKNIVIILLLLNRVRAVKSEYYKNGKEQVSGKKSNKPFRHRRIDPELPYRREEHP